MKKVAKLLIVVSLLTAGAGAYAWSVRSPGELRLDASAPRKGSSTEVASRSTARLVAARATAAPVAGKGKRTALLIGINHAAGGSPLYGAVQDAKNAYEALLGYGFGADDITLLIEGQATKARILAELRSLAARTSTDGVAVFSFAGHTGRSGGVNSFRAVDGQRVSAPELGSLLGAVRAPMWIAMPTCYSGGYAVPGIVGPNRIATFASPANEVSYEVGSRGSYLIHYMVRQGMIEKKAPGSIEDAFEYARKTIQDINPNRVPLISDGITGELDLTAPAPELPVQTPQNGGAVETSEPEAPESPDADKPPTDDPDDPSAGGVEVCGLVGCRD